MRRAFLHSSVPLTVQARSLRQPKPEFKRDELPHSGRTPEPDRRPRVAVDRVESYARYPNDRAASSSYGPDARYQNGRASSSSYKPGSRYQNDKPAYKSDRPSYKPDTPYKTDRPGSRFNPARAASPSNDRPDSRYKSDRPRSFNRADKPSHRTDSYKTDRRDSPSYKSDSRGSPDKTARRESSYNGDRRDSSSYKNDSRDSSYKTDKRGSSYDAGSRDSSYKNDSRDSLYKRDRRESSYSGNSSSNIRDSRGDTSLMHRPSTDMPPGPWFTTSTQTLVNESEIIDEEEENISGNNVEYDSPEAADEFDHPSQSVTTAAPGASSSSTSVLQSSGFASPPLLPGFVSALNELLGPTTEPTPIQSLALTYCLPPVSETGAHVPGAPAGWKQFLLASETGSGKSIAYLLPMLQGIKISEVAEQEHPPPPLTDEQVRAQRLYNPRGLILAPTHELARQLAGTAKALLHAVKLRVVCTSRANGATPLAHPDSRSRLGGTASKMAGAIAGMLSGPDGALDVQQSTHKADVVVGTPMKLLEMVRGRGWDRAEQEVLRGDKGVYEELKIRRGRDRVVHFGTWRAKKELGLAQVEWVVVDEADVLFDPDFQETTRMLLADISAARGHVLPESASMPIPPPLAQAPSTRSLSDPLAIYTPTKTPTTTPTTATTPAPTPISYPFNLLLTSATIPKSLASYLATYHPTLVRLASPRLHRLPRTLQTEYVGWTGGRKEADVLRRLRRVWAEDAGGVHATDDMGNGSRTGGASGGNTGTGGVVLSQVLVFCNRSTKVVDLAAYLEDQGIKCVALTSRSEQRTRGSNNYLTTFLRQRPRMSSSATPATTPTTPSSTTTSIAVTAAPTQAPDPKRHPHVLITTSLLSRGLDFSPSIRHVFIVDEPRNTVDFLHRAGRTGRAGAWGKVVVFGKMKGRGAERGREVRRRVSALTK